MWWRGILRLVEVKWSQVDADTSGLKVTAIHPHEWRCKDRIITCMFDQACVYSFSHLYADSSLYVLSSAPCSISTFGMLFCHSCSLVVYAPFHAFPFLLVHGVRGLRGLPFSHHTFQHVTLKAQVWIIKLTMAGFHWDASVARYGANWFSVNKMEPLLTLSVLFLLWQDRMCVAGTNHLFQSSPNVVKHLECARITATSFSMDCTVNSARSGLTYTNPYKIVVINIFNISCHFVIIFMFFTG